MKSLKYIDNSKFYRELPVGTVTDSTRLINNNGVYYIEFVPFDKFPWVKSAFSTRLGGVSNGIYSSMNFSFDRGDDRNNVLKNFDLFTNAIDITKDKCVCSKQTHTTNVMRVDCSHLGMGITKERNFDNIDGLMTNESGVCLVTSFADCIPLIFIDPVNRAVASSHSGWRGTVNNITANTLELMAKEFNTRPEDVSTFIGPGICMDCYEVSEDVAIEFSNAYSSHEIDHILSKKNDDKYLLNLPMANYFNMLNSGIKAENINISDICTCCNSDILFSHRASMGKRGVLCNFIYIK
ncbi:MAG: peptidoglycan editing factor PgeF [Eubacteriales bacterium]|nr:peptidoglycan editing factor PgeF [Eubacteriales bacterium]